MRILTGSLSFVILAVFVIVCSVMFFSTPYAPDKVIASTLSHYAVPGGCMTDPHYFRSKKIDEDAYGRILYTFTNYDTQALCIAQMADDTYVYYYDTLCYRHVDDFKAYEQETEKMEALKEANDWGKELAPDRMTKRELNRETDMDPAFGYGELLHQERSEALFEEYVALPDGFRYRLRFCDYNGAGQELYYAKVFAEEDGALEGWDEPRYYFMVVNEDGSYDPDTFLLGFEVWEESNGPLAEIKMQNGWYGDA